MLFSMLFSAGIENLEFPSLKIINKKNKIFNKVSISDIDAIKSKENILSFAYYTANRLTKDGNKRWYISPIKGSLEGYVFSLMPIINGNAGWAEVGKKVAYVDVNRDKITIGNIEDNPTYEYKDWGLNRIEINPIIQEDIELIRNSTVDIKWWFFKASNGYWYIVNKESIYKFASKNNNYDWQKIDTNGFKIELFVEDGYKKMRLLPNDSSNDNIEQLPQLNLHHKSETLEIIKRDGCNFIDVYPYMLSSNDKEEDYIRSICQAGIMQGDLFENDKFKPFAKVDGIMVAKVLSLVYDYDGVKKFCSQSIYDESDESQCYVDFAKKKGMIIPSETTVKRYEFYTSLANIFWDQNFTLTANFDDVFKGWGFLGEKGIFFKSLEDQMYSDEYGIFSDLTRWELAVLSLRSSRLSKEEKKLDSNSSDSSKAELPYSITPDNKEISDVDKLFNCLVGYLIDDISEEEFNRCLDENLWNAEVETKQETFFIPKNSLPEPVKITETSKDELPNAIVKTAKDNIGKKAPYTDGRNTIDTRLITTVYGQEVKYKSAKEMCNDYEAQGKLEFGLPTDKDLRGYVVCYKEDTKGTEGKGHVAIIVDSKGEREIGVQSIKEGVMERPTDKVNIKGVIAPTSINLPTF
jgi:hypothetical protein